jgi:thiamine pyrophosphokinase
VEHAVANLLLLAHPMLDGVDVAILDGPSTLWPIGSAAGPGAAELHGSAGDHVSLFALGGTVEGVVTSGLRYPLHGEALAVGPARGLSNELLAADAGVTTERGRLLVIHTVRTTDRPRGAA